MPSEPSSVGVWGWRQGCQMFRVILSLTNEFEVRRCVRTHLKNRQESQCHHERKQVQGLSLGQQEWPGVVQSKENKGKGPGSLHTQP